jgi:predicted RecA/RadA family phage recombinase
MKNFLQDGKVIEWLNETGATVASGDVAVMGTVAGVAVHDIEDDVSGSVRIEGVFTLPKKAALAIAIGARVYWDADPGEVTTVVADGVPLGICTLAAAADDATVEVKLDPTGDQAPQAAVIAAIGASANLTAIEAVFADLAAARVAVNTLKTETEARLDAIEAKVDALIAALKLAGLMANA